MIIANQLSKTFGRFQAVKDASFTIEKGDIVGFLGPNGAGKTTTLRMLTGYLPPTTGTATIAGCDIVKQTQAARKHLGYLPEHVPLYDDQRVTEYLKYRARLKGIASRQIWASVAQVVEQCGLDQVRRKMIRTLSKGYRQRVGLADALLGQPDLLILDEPTNGLDPNQIRQIRELIKTLSEKHTIILSTHILSEVEMICNKVIIIDQGTIKAYDTPANLTGNLRAAGRISVEFKGNLDTMIPLIETLENVKKVIHESTDEKGWHAITVRAEAGTDTREKLAQLLISQHCLLRHMHRHIPNLEEVFVEMTRRD
ncbi:MAG: ABC transporter ATP-binding protein [Akkermansia sp.]